MAEQFNNVEKLFLILDNLCRQQQRARLEVKFFVAERNCYVDDLYQCAGTIYIKLYKCHYESDAKFGNNDPLLRLFTD